MMQNIMLKKHLTKWSSIDGKKQKTENWALGDSKRELDLAEQTFTRLNLLTSASQIGRQLIVKPHSNPNPVLQSA